MKQEDDEGDQDDEDQAKRCSQTKAQAIEKDDAYERLTNIVGEGHATHSGHTGEEDIVGGRMLISHAEANDVGGRHRKDTDGVEC